MTISTLTKLAGALLAFCMLPGAKGGCGSKEANTTFNAQLQSITILVERSDGRVDAVMHLINSENGGRFITDAIDPKIRIPGGTFVDLKPAGDGRYAASSIEDSALTYVAGESYKALFELEPDALPKGVESTSFSAVIDSPDDKVQASVTEAPEFTGDTATIEWTPKQRAAHITVSRDGQIVWTSMDFATPNFDGSKWGRLGRAGSHQLGADVFKDAGTYLVSVCALADTNGFDEALSAELGVLSGFLVGRCAPDLTLEVTE